MLVFCLLELGTALHLYLANGWDEENGPVCQSLFARCNTRCLDFLLCVDSTKSLEGTLACMMGQIVAAGIVCSLGKTRDLFSYLLFNKLA